MISLETMDYLLIHSQNVLGAFCKATKSEQLGNQYLLTWESAQARSAASAPNGLLHKIKHDGF